MTTVTMRALDTLHISAVGPDNLTAGEESEVPEGIAKDLEDRGLAERVGGKAKAEPAPQNKMEEAPDNKADKPPVSAMSAKRKGK